ncbi:hypothetical protein [Kribbella sp. VKM Ac-2568]|uniref:hypothetical protein n=1 Tax=Kribbella sp. VKM Ac-2568 TaxID=2512219 RepID=UPI00130510F6|nr:hypothetical protein [Kribbella sp. VKM Ac-2568]
MPERLIEWFRQPDAGLADSDRDDLVGDLCVIPGQFADLLDPLGEHEHEDCCGSVPGGELCGVHDSLDRLVLRLS